MTYPTGYSLLSDFTLGAMPSGWTFNRASGATDSIFTDAAGSSYNTFANDVPRFFGTTGWIFEGQARTNYLFNSAAPATQTTPLLAATIHVLWVIGTGSATVTAGTGAATGLGTATAGNPLFFTVTTAGTFVVTVTGTLNRFQLERGNAPTTFIVTAGAIGTRAAETCTYALAAWFNAGAGTLGVQVQYIPPMITGYNSVGIVSLDDATVSNRFNLCMQPNSQLVVTTASVSQVNTTTGVPVTAGTPQRIFARYSSVDMRLAGGGVLSPLQTGKTIPTVTRLAFVPGAAATLGCMIMVQRVIYFPFALSDADLQNGSLYPPVGAPLAQSSGGAASARGAANFDARVNIAASGQAMPRGTAVTPQNIYAVGIPPVSGVGKATLVVQVPPFKPPTISYPTSSTFIPSDVYAYLDRIPRWNRGHPKFVAEVYMLCAAAVVIRQFNDSLTTLFDVDTAVGVQLDMIGEWVGRSRRINNPITDVYFSWDTDGLGWDQGVWLGPFDPLEGLVSLDDNTYRLVIKAKIAANSWDSTMGEVQTALAPLVELSPGTRLYMKDGQDMTFTIALAGAAPPLVIQSLILGGIIPFKPEGVRVDAMIVSVNNTGLFGFDAENDFIQGWDIGSWGITSQTIDSGSL